MLFAIQTNPWGIELDSILSLVLHDILSSVSILFLLHFFLFSFSFFFLFFLFIKCFDRIFFSFVMFLLGKEERLKLLVCLLR